MASRLARYDGHPQPTTRTPICNSEPRLLPRRQPDRRLCRCRDSSLAREVIHPVIAERPSRGEIVVHAAKKANVVRRRRPFSGPSDEMVELDTQRRPTDASRYERPLAAPTISQPHLALHRGGDGTTATPRNPNS